MKGSVSIVPTTVGTDIVWGGGAGAGAVRGCEGSVQGTVCGYDRYGTGTVCGCGRRVEVWGVGTIGLQDITSHKPTM